MSLTLLLSQLGSSDQEKNFQDISTSVTNRNTDAFKLLRATLPDFQNLINDEDLWMHSWHHWDSHMSALLISSLRSSNIFDYFNAFVDHHPLDVQRKKLEELSQALTDYNIPLNVKKEDWESLLHEMQPLKFEKWSAVADFIFDRHRPDDIEELFHGALLSGDVRFFSKLSSAVTEKDRECVNWASIIKHVVSYNFMDSRPTNLHDVGKSLRAFSTLAAQHSWFANHVDDMWKKGFSMINPLAWVDVNCFEALGVQSQLSSKKTIRVNCVEQLLLRSANQFLLTDQWFPHVDWSGASIQDMMTFCGNVREKNLIEKIPLIYKVSPGLRSWSDGHGNGFLHYMASNLAIGFISAKDVAKVINALTSSHLGALNQANHLGQTPLSIIKKGFDPDGQMKFGSKNAQHYQDMMDVLASKWVAKNISKALPKANKQVVKTTRKM